MPPDTTEVKHYHQKAQQFFFILKGEAEFEIDNKIVKVSSGEGLQIEAGRSHKIMNNTEVDLEFILCSQPSATNDRINCQ